MKIIPLHAWDVSPKEAVVIQDRLARQIVLEPRSAPPKIVAGADMAFDKAAGSGFAAVVLLRFPSLQPAGKFTVKGTVKFPYVPGLLSFREAPLLLKAFEQVEPAPDLIFFDGQGLAHPRKLGLASHLGLFLDCPTVGCAKSRLTGHYEEPGRGKGSSSPLVNDAGENLGAAVRTRDNCNPVYVSPGHKIDIDSAVRWTLQCTTRYRIPEPTRLAHNLVGEYKNSGII
ncbi:MAG: deoxyribonuclease V [Nitrospinae bacterium]|nr:deoxyribonuclease V [Nitrospinota bacterium]